MEFFELGPRRASALSGDFATVVYRQSLLGFNLVRIPFRFATLDERPRSSLAHNCALPSRQAVKNTVSNPLPPFDRLPYDSWLLPSPPAPPPRRPRHAPACNWYLPDGSVRDRLLWATQYYVANGFYVILDYHPATPEAEAAQDSALLSDTAALAAAWRRLAADVAALPAWRDGRLKGRVFFELVNEPDRLGLAWNDATIGHINDTAIAARTPTADPRPLTPPGFNATATDAVRKLGSDGGASPPSTPTVAAASAAVPPARRLLQQPKPRGDTFAKLLAAGAFNYTQRPLAELLLASGDAVVSAAPGALLILQGTNQSVYTPPMAWGSAFMTDPAVAAAHASAARPYSDAAPFLEAWLARPHLAAVTALGPHVYGPSMAWSPEDNTGATLWTTLDKTFGARSAWGARFPVIVTEFGSHLDDPADVAWLRDFAAWANGRPPATTAPGHRPIQAWAWWQWSPTAWDTGGMVDDDWVTPRWDKIGNLTTVAGVDGNGGGWWLAPWYVRRAVAGRVEPA